jgi:hypothetical protein
MVIQTSQPQLSLVGGASAGMMAPQMRHRLYSAQELMGLEEDPNRWIVPNMIPKASRVLVYGDGATFKTSIMFDLCIAVAARRKLLRQFPVQHFGPVLIVSTESNIHENSRRLKGHARAHGIDMGELPLTYCQDPFYLDDAQDQRELASIIEELRPAIVMLDPLDSCFLGDENSARDTKHVRLALNAMIDAYECTFIIIHHASKGVQGAKKLPRGSTAWYGWADSVILCEKKHIKLGLPTKQKFLEMTAKKQRNGEEGRVLSGVPVYDEVLQTFTFNIYEGKDRAAVVDNFWAREAYKVLRFATEPMTTKMLAEKLEVRSDRLAGPMQLLEGDSLAAKDCFVLRPYGNKGGTRKVPAWRALKRYTVAELSEIMVRVGKDEPPVNLCPLLPEEAAARGYVLGPDGIFCRGAVELGP